MPVGATFTGTEVADWLHAATIAIVSKTPVELLWQAVPPFPTRSEIWLKLLERREADLRREHAAKRPTAKPATETPAQPTPAQPKTTGGGPALTTHRPDPEAPGTLKLTNRTSPCGRAAAGSARGHGPDRAGYAAFAGCFPGMNAVPAASTGDADHCRLHRRAAGQL